MKPLAIFAALIVLLMTTLACQTMPTLTPVPTMAIPTPTPEPPTVLPTPLPTEDIRPSVIQSVFGTQTAVVQSLSTTQTAEAPQFISATKAAETKSVQGMKTEVAVQIAAALTALIPTPTPSRTPTITPTPTQTPTPTATLPPGFRFWSLRWEPPNPYTGDSIVFVVAFDNSLSVLQQVRWRVEIMDMDNNPTWAKLFFMTEPVVSDVNPGRYEFRAEPPWHISASAGKRNFLLHVVTLDISNRVIEVLKTPSGQEDFPLWLVPRGK